MVLRMEDGFISCKSCLYGLSVTKGPNKIVDGLLQTNKDNNNKRLNLFDNDK